MRRFILLLALCALVAAACGAGPTDAGQVDDPTTIAATLPTTTSLPSTTSEEDPDERIDMDMPPPVVVSSEQAQLSLDPWSACWGMMCYDGAPPLPLPDIGTARELMIDFPAEGWEFRATVTPAETECGRHQTEVLQPVGGTAHMLSPIGPAGTYDVDVFGRGVAGGTGGDVIVSFRWTTPIDGAMPVPQATASILADHDGAVDSYGVEVALWNLAATPSTVAAEVTVTAADGSAHTIPLTAEADVCSEGRVHLRGADAEGEAAAALGEGPFMYEVRLVLDGTSYVGTAKWPTDEDPECAPCVPLRFDPPLPALDGGGTDEIDALQVEGVWVFSHSQAGGDDALHGGVATIENGCLYVDGAIVVWHVDGLAEAKAAIASVREGGRPELSIGGGGISLDEGAAELPASVTQRCDTTTVWFGTP